jgi:hypothetical protein
MKMKTLSQVNPKAEFDVDPRKIGLKRPEVLSRVAKGISVWTLIEALTAQVVIYSLKGDVRIATEMYLSITSSGASNAALKTAVRLGLPAKYAELFNAIWMLSGGLADERHRLAHWAIGYCEEIPNALLLANPRDGLKRGAHNISVGRLQQYGKFTPRPINQIRVLSVEYLDDLIERLQAQLDRIHSFIQLLSMHELVGFDGSKQRASDLRSLKQEYDLLCNEPQIRQILTLARGRLKNKKATQRRRSRSKTQRPPK